MLSAAKDFSAAMASADIPAYWLSLVGSSGTGKTMLARRITRLFSRHIEGLVDELRSGPGERHLRKGGFLSWPSCVEAMMEGDFGFMRQAQQDWFLVLDDVGADYEKLRELSVSKLFGILNARQGKFTVLTCNYSMDQISTRLDTRIASRLIRHGGVVVDTTGMKDFNLLPSCGPKGLPQ